MEWGGRECVSSNARTHLDEPRSRTFGHASHINTMRTQAFPQVEHRQHWSGSHINRLCAMTTLWTTMKRYILAAL